MFKTFYGFHAYQKLCVGRYVHRVGRTARMGKVGEAFLFLLPCERGYLAKLEATGVHLQPTVLLPALDLLPGHPGQQVPAVAHSEGANDMSIPMLKVRKSSSTRTRCGAAADGCDPCQAPDLLPVILSLG